MSSPFLKDGAQYHKDFNESPLATGDHYLETTALDTRSLSVNITPNAMFSKMVLNSDLP